MKKNIKYTLLLLILGACDVKTSQEDIQLNRMIAEEQLIANNNFVKSMGAQLEFFGAPADEGKYYQYSRDIVKLRNNLLNEEDGLIAFSDTVDLIYDKYIRGETYVKARNKWDESLEHLYAHYKEAFSDNPDSATYFKLKYIIFKKEYALHLFNAQMLPD